MSRLRTLGLFFSGQGSQHSRMGDALFRSFPVFSETFQEAEEVLGLKLKELIMKGSEEELRLTSNAQPLLLVFSVGVFRLLDQEFDLSNWSLVSAGHSLGEYSAIVCAGALSFEDGVKLTRKRGEFMAMQPGGMLAVLGMEIDEVEDHARGENCDVANDNCPGQVVVSGSEDGLQALSEKLKTAKCSVVRLPVSGPFHSRFMVEPKKCLRNYMEEEGIKFEKLNFPVISNVTALPYEIGKEKDLLLSQMDSRIRWHECVQYMISHGASRMLELGPKKVLTDLLKRIDTTVSCTPVNKDLDCCQFLKQRLT